MDVGAFKYLVTKGKKSCLNLHALIEGLFSAFSTIPKNPFYLESNLEYKIIFKVLVSNFYNVKQVSF